MKLFRTALFALSLALAACGGKETIPEEKPGGETPPEENPPPVYVDGPYQYDNDLDYDAQAFLDAYKGTPYDQARHVPGTVEAEDFDEGTQNVAYFESDDMTAASYRNGSAVDIAASGASNGYHVGHVQSGEWLNYTIEVDEDGAYSIDTYCVKGDNSEGSFYFEVDGRGASRSIAIPQGGWEDFTHKATATDIQLSKGKHVLKFFGSTPGNVDKFVFTRTGDMQDPSTSITYPQTKAMANNPLFTEFGSPMYNSWLKGNLYTADASAHVWNIDGKEVLYVYASHDMEPAAGCDRMDRYHVFSTEDMVNWTDHGEIMNAATVTMQSGWGCEGFMWAPDCVYNAEAKLYYFYFPHPTDATNWNTTWRIGVATSPYPDKEFRVRGYVKGLSAEIDPCVFVDDDGQAYIYNGGGGKLYGGKLKKNDWTQLDGSMQAMTGMADFHEAAWVHKRNGVYYLSYSDNNPGANRMRYATSNSPLGPWTYKDIYLDVTTCDTSHGSIVEYKDQWYAFYHTSDVSGQGTLRSVCVDELNYNADGTIQKVKQTR